MKKFNWKPYVALVAGVEAAGALVGFLTRDGVKSFAAVRQSRFTPPGAVFPPVWAALFALMGIGAARVWSAPPSPERTRGLRLFGAQLAVNLAWSFLFFNCKAFSIAFAWLILLWILILMMTLSFRKVDKPAAWLQVPYLLWVAFAGYLSWSAWVLNP